MASLIDQSMKNVKVRTAIDDLWLKEREPYFGLELSSVPRPKHAGRGKKKMDKCKSKHRTDIKQNEWEKYDYFSKASTADLLGLSVTYPVSPQIDRVHESRLSVKEFQERYERPCIPCLLSGCADKWPARKEWSYDSFSKKFSDVMLKCGEDDDGYKVKIKVKYFLEYMYLQRDDSPLYLFDSSFDEYEETKALVDHYKPPKYFRKTCFGSLERNEAPHRWFLIGPKRSGTTVHIDPLATSAWNTLLRGRKCGSFFHQKRLLGSSRKHHILSGRTTRP